MFTEQRWLENKVEGSSSGNKFKKNRNKLDLQFCVIFITVVRFIFSFSYKIRDRGSKVQEVKAVILTEFWPRNSVYHTQWSNLQ